MEIQKSHHSHEHPLTLSEVENDDGEEIVCKGCCQKMLDSSVYSCKDCLFFLHKLCAELPTEMKHPMHSEHPLTLLPQAPYSNVGFICNVCRECSSGFTYHCYLCEFDVDLKCAVRAQSVKHKIHEHPLSPLLTAASFECHACGTEHEGAASYLCNTCRFWIHQDCALLPTTFTHSNHVHPLTLIFSAQDAHYYEPGSCYICWKKMNKKFWFYQCKGCTYFVHVNCATMTKTRGSGREIKIEDLDEANLIHLPAPNESADLIGQFVKQISYGGGETEIKLSQFNLIAQFMKQISLIVELVKQMYMGTNEGDGKLNHFSHKHPLIFFNTHNEHKNDKICDACVRPISIPFYSCSSLCDFFLHEWCAELPNKLQHPCHPHPLILLGKRSGLTGFFHCNGCQNLCNGFRFRCDKCSGYYLDVKCASLPNYIMHEVHEHPLRLKKSCAIEGCVACDRCDWTFSFGCRTCTFSLHYKCALLPRMISHRYDKHPFILTHGPINGGPDEYICELCEKYINPNWWFYHCIDCDQSVCTKCIYKEEKEFPNVK